MDLYQYEFKDVNFSDDGFDRRIGLDRYSIKEMNIDKYNEGDIVLFQTEYNGSMNVGFIFERKDDNFIIKDTKGTLNTVHIDLVSKPLEVHPSEWWNRWSEALVSCETSNFDKWRNEYRWLFDGFRFTPGGRIMLALGQEYLNLPEETIEKHHRQNLFIPAINKKSNLTLYNCFVGTKPPGVRYPEENESKYEFYTNPSKNKIEDMKMSLLQFKLFIEKSLMEEADVMKHGGGYGTNVSDINTIKSTNISPDMINFYLPNASEEVIASINTKKLGVYSTIHQTKDTLQGIYDLIEIEDSLDDILKSLYIMVEKIFSGKRVVVSFEKLRHRGKFIKKINGRSSGRVSWAELYEVFAYLLSLEYADAVDFAEALSKLVHIIQQGGSRRGALLILLEASRLDIIDKFVNRKKELHEGLNTGKWLTGANISIGIDDTFMKNVHACIEKRNEFIKTPKYNEMLSLIMDNEDYDISSDINEKKLYDYKNKIFLQYCDELSLNEKTTFKIWFHVIEAAYSSAEPGVIFLERYNSYSNSYYYVNIVSTNP